MTSVGGKPRREKRALGRPAPPKSKQRQPQQPKRRNRWAAY